MADMSKLKKNPLGAPPKPEAVLGNVKTQGTSLLDLARQRAAEKDAALKPKAVLEVSEEPAQAEKRALAAEKTPKKGGKGRPPLDYPTRQLGARVHADTFTRVQAIARRERVGLGPLVDRMVAAWERQRFEEASAIGPRLDGEDVDTYIARIFKL